MVEIWKENKYQEQNLDIFIGVDSILVSVENDASAMHGADQERPWMDKGERKSPEECWKSG